MQAFASLLFAICITSCLSLSCKDDAGNDVDWFIAYKIPRLEKDPSPFKSGYSYAYITSNTVANGWTLSSKLITDATSITGNTLAPLYAPPGFFGSSISHVAYNDQKPTSLRSSAGAHAKGVVALRADTGFWLVHSVPKFPPGIENGATYSYPSNGKENGQSLICISVKTADQGSNVANQLLTMRPSLYSHQLNADVLAEAPEFAKLVAKKWPKGIDHRNVDVKTLGGTTVKSFSKNSGTNDDLYSEIIAPVLATNLFVETWRNGAGHPLSSECNETYHVNNVVQVKMQLPGVNNALEWKSSEDHAKWAVSDALAVPYVCIGDINRMQSQFKRGGGSLCISNPHLWTALSSSIDSLEPCPQPGALPTHPIKRTKVTKSKKTKNNYWKKTEDEKLVENLVVYAAKALYRQFFK